MFQRNKNSYQISAVCENEENEGYYTFIENYDEDWGEIAARMFYDEFGTYPTSMKLESREKL